MHRALVDLKAGQQAVARSAMTEAVAQLRRGLQLLASMPDGADHEQRELELQAALVPAVIATKRVFGTRGR